MTRERVGIVRVREQRLDQALQQLIALLGGSERLDVAGKRVIVKPNLTFAPTDRGITHTEVIEAIVRLISMAGATDIAIAESSGDTYTSQAFRFQGVYGIAARYGARVIDLNLEEGIRTPLPPGLGRDYVMVPRAISEAEFIISVPVYKLWGGNPMSLSLKNLFGLYGGRYYGYNKNSSASAGQHAFYDLPGEVGTELGSHQPTTPQSICAVNTAAPTQLSIIDALEGGDGQGNWIRLNTLIGGWNAVATDTVGMALSGFEACKYETFRLCAERGLGPCSLQEIDVAGESIATAAFPLGRLRDNVLEMPPRFCLELLSTSELHQIIRGQSLYELIPTSLRLGAYPDNAMAESADREATLDQLAATLASRDYVRRAVAACGEHARGLLKLIAETGGTSGDLNAIRMAFSAQHGGNESLYYAPAARTLGRLGLAYPVRGTGRDYWLLLEGVTEALESI